MAQHVEVYPGSLGEIRAASASGGTPLVNTAPVVIILPDGVNQLDVIGRNFATAVVMRVGLCPYLVVLKTVDALATAPTDYSQIAQNAGPVVLSALDTLANGDYLLLGSHRPFRGLAVDVLAGHANGTIASVLTAEYWNGTAWVSLAATDGTATAGRTFAVDGQITWTVPAAWIAQDQATAVAAFIGAGKSLPIVGRLPIFWVRLRVSVAMPADVQVTSIIALGGSANLAEFAEGQGFEAQVSKMMGGVSAVEAMTDAGTANVIVNVYTRHQARFV